MGFEKGQPEETLKEALQRWAKSFPMTLKLQADLLGIPESALANALNPNIDSMHYHLRWLIPHTVVVGGFRGAGLYGGVWREGGFCSAGGAGVCGGSAV